jgi:hypothetical protein
MPDAYSMTADATAFDSVATRQIVTLIVRNRDRARDRGRRYGV